MNGRQWGKRQPVVTRRDVHAGLMPLMLQRLQLLLHRALPAETPPPKRVQCLFRITHSWLRVGQHFLAAVAVVGLWLTNETLNRAKQKLDRNWKASNAMMVWIRSLIHVNTEGTKKVKYGHVNHRDSQIFFKSARKLNLLKVKMCKQWHFQFTFVLRYHWLCV